MVKAYTVSLMLIDMLNAIGSFQRGDRRRLRRGRKIMDEIESQTRDDRQRRDRGVTELNAIT